MKKNNIQVLRQIVGTRKGIGGGFRGGVPRNESARTRKKLKKDPAKKKKGVLIVWEKSQRGTFSQNEAKSTCPGGNVMDE